MDTIFAVIHRKPRSTIFFFATSGSHHPGRTTFAGTLRLGSTCPPHCGLRGVRHVSPFSGTRSEKPKNDMTTCEARGDLTI
jgi:hypothetical protein